MEELLTARDTPGSAREWNEVRLLGPLRVRTADGTHVPERDWRTGKNVDLLRWLALSAGEPVTSDALADGLWPDVDGTKARASLRTAVAHLRRVLGPAAIERVGAGLVLTGCWVDALSFVQLADDVDRHRRAGRLADAYTAALEADALYVADPPVGNGSAEPLVEHAHALSALRHRVLGDAAEAALGLGWARDAVDVALRLRELDPLSERASRVLMLGQASLGEVSHALAEHERIRRVLADELGVDPSPQTREAHLEVLSPTPAAPVQRTFVGRASELHWLSTILEEVRHAPDRGKVVALSGPVGSGRHRLVSTACEHEGLQWVEVRPGQSVEDAAVDARGRVLVWRPDPGADPAQVCRLLTAAVPLAPALAVVLLLPPPGEVPLFDDALQDGAVRSLQLRPLLLDDVAALAHQVLCGPALPGLLEELQQASGGLPGPVLSVLAQWRSAGLLTATSRGLALAPRGNGGGSDREQLRAGRRALARALPRLEGDALEALQLAALLDRAVTPALLAPVLTEAVGIVDDSVLRVRATTALDQLVDLTLLRHSSAGAVWRHPVLPDVVRAWMRPVLTQRLHRRIAGQAPMPSAARVQHWLAAGERELACVAALEAAADCSSRGDHAGARTHLLAVCSLGDLPDASAEDRVDLFESLGDACCELRRAEEARTAYSRALELALAALLPSVSRLRRKLDAASDLRALDVAPATRQAVEASVLAGFGAVPPGGGDLSSVEAGLLDAVEQADRRHDQRRAVEARLRMAAAVCLPRRDFRGVVFWVQAALAADVRPADQLRGVIARHSAAVLLGGAATARAALDDAARAARAAGEQELQLQLLAMRVVVSHDLGDSSFDTLLDELEERVRRGPADELVRELAAVGTRVLAEREELDRAAELGARVGAGEHSSPLVRHLTLLANAELATGLGDHRQAADLLRTVVDDGRASGRTLLVPEAAARLVVLEAAHDEVSARAAFEVCDEVAGARVGGPREEHLRRLARAAVRAAHGDVEGAAASCAQSASLAVEHGLQVLAARARSTRAGYLRTLAGTRSTTIKLHDRARTG